MNDFYRPDQPFVLILENYTGEQLINYFETEKELFECAEEHRDSKYKPIDAFEIHSSREIDLATE